MSLKHDSTPSVFGSRPVEVLTTVLLLTLAALALFPAMNSVRCPSQRTMCINNQRNLVLAMQQYDMVEGRLPGWAEPMVDWKEAVPRPMSWVWPILPYLERGDLYKRGTTDVPGDEYNRPPTKWSQTGGSARLSILNCWPTRRRYDPGAPLCYVVNAGYRDGAATSAGLGAGGRAGSLVDADGPESAVFLNRYPNPAQSGPLPVQTLAYIAAGDGTAHTLMFSESLTAGDWDFGAPGRAEDAREGDVAFCFADRRGADAGNLLRINAAWNFEKPALMDRFFEPRGEDRARSLRKAMHGRLPSPSSLHDRGVVAAFCDGQTQFVSEDVDWIVWAQLFTPRGAEVVVPGAVGPSVFARDVLPKDYEKSPSSR